MMRFLTSEGRIKPTSTGPPIEGTCNAPEFLDSAMAHHQAGRVQEARVIYQSILQTHPKHPDVLHLSGVAAYQRGENKIAVSLIEKAIKINPTESNFYNSCGEAYRALHKYDLAIVSFQQAVTIDPYSATANYNLALTLLELGQQEDAITHFEQVLATDPYFAEAHNNMGVVLQESGRQAEAITHFEQALAIDPYLPEAHSNLGIICKILDRSIEAIVHHQKSMRLGPGELKYAINFAECLSNLQITQATDSLKEDILKTFSLEGVNHHEMAFASASIVKHSVDFQNLATFIDCNSKAISVSTLLKAGLDKVCSEQLLLVVLKKAIIRDPQIEQVLTAIRSSLLHTAMEEVIPSQEMRELSTFVCALAHQCFLNEYVFAVSKSETAKIEDLTTLVMSDAENLNGRKNLLIAIIACYFPLYNLGREKIFTFLIEKSTDRDLIELITQQIVEPNEEKELRNKIKTIGTIDNEISQKVRNQYEENPYPRWLSIHNQNGETVRRLLRRLFPHILPEQIHDNPSPDILVAGCGTGQQVINKSLGIQSSKVLGADISLTSLSYAKRKTRELKLTDVEFIHADILNLQMLNRTFDLIECIGVLHHMDDPVKGWQVLANLLNPGGLMRIGLYSKIARKDIVAAQAYVLEKGYAATPNGIRKCRQDIFGVSNDSIIGNVAKITDFYTLSETRDLLFHIRENRFTLLQIAKIIKKLGLTFVGFEFDNPSEQKKYLKDFPDDPKATSLRNWHKYELRNTNAFIGLYLFWVQKSA